MSEQYPLLCEEASDEDRLRTSYRRRQCPRTIRGRAKYHLRGAAVVMTRWPDYWRSALAYWLIGLGMISFTTLVIYNTFVLTGFFQQTMPILQPVTPVTPRAIYYSSVNMHLFVNASISVDKYISHIEKYANKYKRFSFNLYIVANDTIRETTFFTDKTNNDEALNSLWDYDLHDMHNYAYFKTGKGKNNNINVDHVTITQILNQSPLVHQWKNLPHQFIPFLVRAVSVWNMGGIAVNPDIFMPNSYFAAYVYKFDSIIKSFKKTKVTVPSDLELPSKYNKHLPKVNNIRDIINALEKENSTDSSGEEILYAAESRNNFNDNNSNENLSNINQPTKQSIIDRLSDHLPHFLDFLFHNKKSNKSIDTNTLTNELKITNIENDRQLRNFTKELKTADAYRPMIVSSKKKISNDHITIKHNKASYQDDLIEITVDLNGNLIATGTPCHAFIGNMFVNAIHHDAAESIADFVIKELSNFSKGIDVLRWY